MGVQHDTSAATAARAVVVIGTGPQRPRAQTQTLGALQPCLDCASRGVDDRMAGGEQLGGAVLDDQSLMDSPGRVSLLSWNLAIRLQSIVDR